MEPRPGAQARGPATAEVVMSSLHGGLQWGVDRMLSVGYGLLYDYIFEKFGPYQKLQAEVLALVEASAKQSPDRRAVQVLDIDCGPGNLTFVIAEAGFSVVGLEPYGALVELAREKRRAKGRARQHQGLPRRVLRPGRQRPFALRARRSPGAAGPGPSHPPAWRPRDLREPHAPG